MQSVSMRGIAGVIALSFSVGGVLAADIDGDGVDDAFDVCCNTPAGASVDAQGRPLGDLDLDCDVDLADFAIFAANYSGPLTPVSCGPNCADSIQNGGESDVDCGGPCPPCPNGDMCLTDSDCQSLVCVAGICQPPSCSDGVLNGSETDVDCGGGMCSPCANGEMCLVAVDCQSLLCQSGFCQAPSCTDLVKNGNETDVDCGGGTCPACADGLICLAAVDCQSLVCMGGFCQTPTCSDGVQNGGETGVDCGGPCPACLLPDGSPCAMDGSCVSGFCVDGYCCGTACTGVCQACDQSGSEGICVNIAAGADPDNECAGASNCNGVGGCTSLLPDGSACAMDSSCASGFCVDGVCCGSACAGICQECDQFGFEGICLNIPSGTDPDNECAGASTCDGAGACMP